MGWTKEWQAKNRNKINARRRERYRLNINGFKDKNKLRQHVEYAKRRAYYKLAARNQYRENREACIRAYSEGKMCCNCCGESIFDFLTLDHINGDGAAHRKEMVGRKRTSAYGSEMYAWLKKRNFPDRDKLQVLCYNCNCAKRTYDICPHKKLNEKK